MSAQLRAGSALRPAGATRSLAVRPMAVALPRRTAVVAKAQEKNTVAALAVCAQATVHALDPTIFQSFLAEHANRLVVLDFYTDWCGPCKMVAPELERMASAADPSRLVFAKLNCGADNDSKRLAVALGIKALPTFHLYKEGKVQSQMTGAKVKALQELINKHI